MLEERLQQHVEELRVEGRSESFIQGFIEGFQKGYEEARLELKEWRQEVALKLIAFGSLSNEQIADITELSLDDVKALIKNGSC